MFHELKDALEDLKDSIAITREPYYGCNSSMSASSNFDWADSRLSSILKTISPKAIMFMADAPNHENAYSLVDEYWNLQGRLLKGCSVVSSDYSFPRKIAYPVGGGDHITDLHLNHLKPMVSMSETNFDLIAGRALICWCPSAAVGACGLPSEDVQLGASFLFRISKLLNASNPQSVACFHGYGGGSNEKSIEFWKAAAKSATDKHEELDVALLYHGKSLKFIRVRVNRKGI